MDPPPPPPLLPQKKGKSKAIDDDGDEKENPMEIVQGEETNPSSQNERKSTTDQQQEEQKQQRKKSSSTMPRGRGRRNNAARRPRRQRQDKDNDFLPLLKQEEEEEEEEEEAKGRGHQIVISRKRKKTNHSDNSRPRSPSPSPSSNKTITDDENESMNSVWDLISDIVMWKNVTKSAFWFGLGSTFFISSSFSRESNFSVISAASHLGILILGLAFFRDSISNRQTKRLKRTTFQLTEDDFLQVARLVLPLANSILAKSQEIFSGESLMTLKVAPILLFTAKFGALITTWRLFAIGFFLSFTIPKLYSSYSKRICKKVEETKNCVWEAWKLCPNKKLVTASTAAVFWNLFSVKMRFFTAFISVVALRYQQQHIGEGISEKESREPEQQTMMQTDENLRVTADCQFVKGASLLSSTAHKREKEVLAQKVRKGSSKKQ